MTSMDGMIAPVLALQIFTLSIFHRVVELAASAARECAQVKSTANRAMETDTARRDKFAPKRGLKAAAR